MRCCCGVGGMVAGVIGAAGTSSGGGGNPPEAAFSGSPLSGDAPLDVTFTDESTGVPTQWFWEKDDGNGFVPFDGDPTDQNPVETLAEGEWTIRLTVTNSGGFDQETKSIYVTVGSEVQSHPFWRLDRWSVVDTAQMGFSELQLLEGGINVAPLAVVTTSTAPLSGSIANLFDGNLTTTAYWDDNDVRGHVAPWSMDFDFSGGPGPVAITQLKFGANDQANRWPYAVMLSWSDDGITYHEYGHLYHELFPYPGNTTYTGTLTPVPFTEVTDGMVWLTNLADKTTGVTVSDGATVVSKNSATYEDVRAILRMKAGDAVRYYFEFELVTVNTGQVDAHYGWIDAYSAIVSGVNPTGIAGWTSFGWDISGARYGFGSLWNSAVAPQFVGNFVAGDILGVYVDCIFSKAWYHRNGVWLNFGAQWDPPAGLLFQTEDLQDNLTNPAMFWWNDAGLSVTKLLSNAADLNYPELAPLGATRGIPQVNPYADEHNMWRVTGITSTNGALEISELQFLEDGVNVTGDRTAQAVSPAVSSGASANLYDGNLATEAGWIAASVPTLTIGVTWNTTPAARVNINGIKIGGFTDSTKYPLGFTLEYSDDGGATWHSAGAVTGLVYPGNNTLSALIPVPTPSAAVDCEILLVAGGGGGGSTAAGFTETGNGGGGGGGVYYDAAWPMVPGSYAVVVGAGGAVAGTFGGFAGGDTTFDGNTAAGGGGGGGQNGNPGSHIWGGSSGGSGASVTSSGSAQFPIPAGMGNAGGAGGGLTGNHGGGGGGGAGAAGADGSSTTGGNGGNGASYSITGSPVTYAGGGGGGVCNGGTEGQGGTGGGGDAGVSAGGNGVAGTANLGGGGGGGSINGGSCLGGVGGAGVFIFRYPTASFTHSGGDATGTDGSDTWVQFNSSGTLILT